MDLPRTWTRPALLCATVLLHGAALLLLLGEPGARRDESDALAMDLVWIRPPPLRPPEPAPRAAVVPLAKPVAPPRRARAAVSRNAPAATSESTLVAVPAEPSEQTEQAAPAVAGKRAQFNHEGALQTARNIARDVDPVAPGTKYKETRDEQLGRAIASAKRQSCLGGNAKGNLLTPLMWLMEKKDSGCKF